MSTSGDPSSEDQPKKLSISLSSSTLKKLPKRNLQTQEKDDAPKRIAVTTLTKDVMEDLGSEKPIVVIPLQPNRPIRPTEVTSTNATKPDAEKQEHKEATDSDIGTRSDTKSLDDRARQLLLQEANALLKGEDPNAGDAERKAREGTLAIAAAQDTSAGSLAGRQSSESSRRMPTQREAPEASGIVIGHETTKDDYTKVSVEDFGYAMLRGMGWKADAPEKPGAVQVKELPSNLGRFGLGLRPEDAALKETLGLTKKRNAPLVSSNSSMPTSHDHGHLKRVRDAAGSDRPSDSSLRSSPVSMASVASSTSKPSVGVEPPALVEGITKGLRVRIIDRRLAGGKYYCVKGTVSHLSRSTRGRVYVEVDSDDRIKSSSTDEVEIDDVANQLETLVPAVGGRVLVLRGRYKDERATVIAKDKENALVDLELEDRDRTIVRRVSFDDISEYPRVSR